MTSLARVLQAFSGETTDRPVVFPIIHAGLAPVFDITMGEFFTNAAVMADTIVNGYRRFGYDGVQLSLGVTAEAEALGAEVYQPADAGPVLKKRLLADQSDLASLGRRDPTVGGRMPMFFEAVKRVTDQIGDQAFVMATLRGPLLAGSQLRGVEPLLMDMIDQPEGVAEILDLTNEIAIRLGRWLRASGAHGLLLGEATCSPNFISPDVYRRLVLPYHKRLVSELKAAGWKIVGFHICGSTLPIIEDVIATGADFMDVDHLVPADQAIERAQGRIVFRGNLDPSSVLRFAEPQQVRSAVDALRRTVGDDARWIIGSGCDIPPGTPAGNIEAFVKQAQGPSQV